MASHIQVQSLDHVTLVVKDLDSSRRFYVDGLGMREVARPAFSFPGAWFQAGPTLIHLIGEHPGGSPAGNPLAEEFRTTRSNHFAFLVDDVEAAYVRAQELEMNIVSPPKSRPDGFVQVFLNDPDGFVVELCSPGK
ncbi:MAG: glyoxalase [Planctomycetes bacterium]|nr:glyoxalase [Planctomycetota bacterium]